MDDGASVNDVMSIWRAVVRRRQRWAQIAPLRSTSSVTIDGVNEADAAAPRANEATPPTSWSKK